MGNFFTNTSTDNKQNYKFSNDLTKNNNFQTRKKLSKLFRKNLLKIPIPNIKLVTI